ncbi:MAG TPA: UDP-3-O-(3-hydroxymyristoyl)glucosamine N-acyltransferase [Cytophagales bacterium]|nr:UDP-3-O-(3-hydroxymyristoyl)glucosamine N-acyltransferase [Cytophagales bacterium]
MEFTSRQIADLLGGRIVGDEQKKINRLAKIEEATEGAISFLSNPKYEQYIYSTGASAVLVNNSFTPREPVKTTLIYVADAYASLSFLLDEYNKMKTFAKVGKESPHFLSEGASLGENCYIGAFAYIGNNCKIGDNVKIYPHVYVGDNVVIGHNTILHPGVKVYSDCQIGSFCTLHAGAIIGSDGFGFAPLPDGTFKTIPQIGNVIIEDHVSIGANTTIDCATMGSTVIHSGVKLDNLIQIGHNVEIGKNTVVAAQAGISGSTKVGENCMIGGQVGIVGHITLADRTSIGAQSGVGGSVKTPGKALSGSPAFDYKLNLKSFAVYKKLPQLLKSIEKLEKNINLEHIE